MRIRLGDVLVKMGAISEEQRAHVLDAQASSGRPFGALAEEMFGVSPKVVEQAWAAQYTELAGNVKLADERIDPEVSPLVERRQAWQFQVLPLRFESGELVIATTEASLPRAMRFVGWALGVDASFVVAGEEDFLAQLNNAHPMPGGKALLEHAKRSA
jgi:type IV pilus assembly protein PilB